MTILKLPPTDFGGTGRADRRVARFPVVLDALESHAALQIRFRVADIAPPGCVGLRYAIEPGIARSISVYRIELAPDRQFSSRQFCAFVEARQAVVSGALARELVVVRPKVEIVHLAGEVTRYFELAFGKCAVN